MRRKLCVLFVFFISFLPLTAFAWNILGHMVVASIAYQNLKPTVKKTVDEMVAYFKDEYPEMETFINIAYWPDALRFQNINSYSHWHYIDVPFTNDNSPLVNTIESDNAVWAIDNAQPVVQNSDANPYERIRFLAFLAHIVGDIHQPLHTVTLISKRHPNSDRHGTLFYVFFENKRLTIHGLWDKGMGLFDVEPCLENADKIAKQIMALHPKAEFGDQIFNLSTREWLKEGFALAKNFAYVTPEDMPVSANYLEKGQREIELRVALAGYRLAEMLNQILSHSRFF